MQEIGLKDPSLPCSALTLRSVSVVRQRADRSYCITAMTSLAACSHATLLYLKNKCKLLPLYLYRFWDNQAKALSSRFQERKNTNYRLTKTNSYLIISIYEIPSLSTAGNTILPREDLKSDTAILLGPEYFPNLSLRKCGLWSPFLTRQTIKFFNLSWNLPICNS